MNATKGMRILMTTTTAGAQLREIVTFVRRADGRQQVVHTSVGGAQKIRAGELNHEVGYLTGFGDVRRIDTQEFHRLVRLGRIVVA